MAHAAAVMRFFATELGRSDDLPRWRQLEYVYRQRTRQLFDAREGRYRDWLTQEGRRQQPRPEQLYWGVDSCRWSPLGLTPLVIGEPLDSNEVWQHAQPPWIWWPSWTYAIVESAVVAGDFERVGELAAEIVERVYRVTTRHELGTLERPMPGCAPELWPEDWRTYQGHDAYGWGASTANLLLRHIVGFKESRVTERWALDLAPALPRQLRAAGQRFGIRQLSYRGVHFDLEYVAAASGVLPTTLRLRSEQRRCAVWSSDGEVVYTSGQSSAVRHEFELRNGLVYRVELS
jgi:hypothetical protein